MEGKEVPVQIRTVSIYYSFVPTIDLASCISSTKMFTNTRGTDQIWDKIYYGFFCIVFTDLFSNVLDVRVKRGAELSTDRLLVVCSKQKISVVKGDV